MFIILELSNKMENYNYKILNGSEYSLPKTDENAPYDLMMNENLQKQSKEVIDVVKSFDIIRLYGIS